MSLPYVDEASSYIYSKTTDFAGGLKLECLDREVREVLTGLIGIYIEEGDDRVVIYFNAVLNTSGETALDAVVSNHDPNCIIEGTSTNTDATDPKNGQILVWDSTAEAWVNWDPPDNKFDGNVLFDNIGHGDVLTYDSTAEVWTNLSPAIDIDTPSSLWTSLGLDTEEDDTLSSTTSLTFQNKLTVTVPAGDAVYRIGYAMEFNAANNNKSVEVRLYNSTDGVDVAGNQQQTNNSANYFSFAGFHYQTMTAAGGSKTFILQFRVATSGTTCNVRNAALEIWRKT